MVAHKNNIQNYLLYVFTFLYIVTSIFSYTQFGDLMKIIKSILQILIIFNGIFLIKLKNYKWMFPLFIILVLYPLLLIGLGIYNLYPTQSTMYVIVSFINLIFYMCLTEQFYNDVDKLINVWQNATFFALTLLMFIYKGLSFNIPHMIIAIITNNRYGNDLLTQRYGMGFNNVNQLALFSSILLICSLYFIINHKRKIFSLINIFLSFIFICNAESRAPFVAVIMATIVILISKINSKVIEKLIKYVVVICIVVFGIIFTYYAMKGETLSKNFQKLNIISSMRLYYTFDAIAFLKLVGSEWIGVGPMSTTFIKENLFGGTLTLDSSIGYYLLTLGIFGTIIIFTILIYLICTNLNNRIIGLIIFFITYALFENTIFIPNSLLSCFGCVTLFILMRRKNEQKKTVINSNYTDI